MLPELLTGLGQPGEVTQPEAKPLSAIHYSKEPIKGGVLHGDKRGSSGEGEDSDRVFLPPRGAPSAIHAYEDNGQVFGKHPSILARPHASHISGNYAIADIDQEPKWAAGKEQGKQLALSNGADEKTAEMVGRNEAEWELKDAGYHGYRSKSAPGNVVLFGDHRATAVGKVAPQETSGSVDMSNPVKEVKSEDSPTPTGPPARVYPMNAHDKHETHPANSDPLRLNS